MSKEEDNKVIVARWFTEFWGKEVNHAVVDEIAAPDMLLKDSLHEPRRGRDDIEAFMTDFRIAFPDFNFWEMANLIAEDDYVVGQWEGGGTHTGPALRDFLIGGFTTEGLPHSFQLVGQHLDEALLVRAGHAYQQATDWHREHPPV